MQGKAANIAMVVRNAEATVPTHCHADDSEQMPDRAG